MGLSLPRSSHSHYSYQAAIQRADRSWSDGQLEHMGSSSQVYTKYWDPILVRVLNVLGLRRPTAIRAYHKRSR